METALVFLRHRIAQIFAAVAAALYLVGTLVPNSVTLVSGPLFLLMEALALAGLVLGLRDIARKKNGLPAFVAVLACGIILIAPLLVAVLFVSH